MKITPQFPGCLDLPGGRVILVVGSTLGGGVPLYDYADGRQEPIDTRIPRDLAGDWFWTGPWGLSNGAVCIATVCYPPPLCYEQARAYEAKMTELQGEKRIEQLAMELV